jgi:hypothetical protein
MTVKQSQTSCTSLNGRQNTSLKHPIVQLLFAELPFGVDGVELVCVCESEEE